MAEFRWILLGLGLLLIAGIWWWSGRRSAQAPGNAELRETTAKEVPRPDVAAADMGSPMDAHEWSRSPFEPLSIKTTDFEQMATLEPMTAMDVDPQPGAITIADDAATVPNADTGPVVPPVLTKAVPATDTRDRIAGSAPRKPNSSEKQKIVSVRVCAPAEERWPGSALLAAFESQGLAFGRYQVFHRRHIDGRSLFSVASLVEPGTFDLAQMAAQQFKGVTLFAVLPGPMDPLQTLDEMLAAANGLAGELPGTVQDAKGAALSPQKMAALRDEVAQFQSISAVS